jgi:cytochrome P450
VNLGAFIPLPKWMPRFHTRDTRDAAQRIRALIKVTTQARAHEIETGHVPNDLSTKIMTTVDPETGDRFSRDEMVDQVAIFFLAGHETSASALAWALYLVAAFPEWQDKIATEAEALDDGFSGVSRLRVTRAVFRETLRLYPPVPMMVRETVQCERFRDQDIAPKTSVVISPWHVHRQDRLWDNPDGFDPNRWDSENGKACARDAFIPFSAGPRVCPGAGFAMIEGVMLLAHILRKFRVTLHDADTPVPVAHLTVRAKRGIFLQFDPRE